MEYVYLAIVVFVLWLISKWHLVKKQEKKEQIAELMSIVEKIQREIDKVQNLKTDSGRANSAGRALGYLRKAEENPQCRAVITNFDDLVARVKAIKKVLPAVGYVDKAYRHNFKGKDSLEKNALLDALYEIQVKDIKNRDFEIAVVMPEGTGEIVRIENIKKRLQQLGWDPNNQ